MLGETSDAQNDRKLREWIERNGVSVTAREVQQGCRWLKNGTAAEEALNRLVKAGHGVWEPTPAGQRGQPTRRFMASAVYGNRQNPAENMNTVDMDALDAA